MSAVAVDYVRRTRDPRQKNSLRFVSKRVRRRRSGRPWWRSSHSSYKPKKLRSAELRAAIEESLAVTSVAAEPVITMDELRRRRMEAEIEEAQLAAEAQADAEACEIGDIYEVCDGVPWGCHELPLEESMALLGAA